MSITRADTWFEKKTSKTVLTAYVPRRRRLQNRVSLIGGHNTFASILLWSLTFLHFQTVCISSENQAPRGCVSHEPCPARRRTPTLTHSRYVFIVNEMYYLSVQRSPNIVEHCGHARVLPTQRLLSDGQRTLVKRHRVGKVFLYNSPCDGVDQSSSTLRNRDSNIEPLDARNGRSISEYFLSRERCRLRRISNTGGVACCTTPQ